MIAGKENHALSRTRRNVRADCGARRHVAVLDRQALDVWGIARGDDRQPVLRGVGRVQLDSRNDVQDARRNKGCASRKKPMQTPAVGQAKGRGPVCGGGGLRSPGNVPGDPLVGGGGDRRPVIDDEGARTQVRDVTDVLRDRAARPVLLFDGGAAGAHVSAVVLEALDMRLRLCGVHALLRGTAHVESVVEQARAVAPCVIVNELLARIGGRLGQPAGRVYQNWGIANGDREPSLVKVLFARVRRIDIRSACERRPSRVGCPGRSHGHVTRAGRDVRSGQGAR